MCLVEVEGSPKPVILITDLPSNIDCFLCDQCQTWFEGDY